MLLGNADRLPVQALGWRGNAGNLLLAQAGRWVGRPVAIDALVQRRPPGGLVSSEVCVRGRARRRRGGRALQLGASPLRSTWLPLQSGDQPTHPPTQDAACERLAELVLNDGGVAEQVLTEALTFARSIPAAAALVNEAAVAEFQQVARSAEGQDWNKPGLTEGGRVLFEAAVFSLPPRIRNPARRACWESAARREMLAPLLTGPRLPCRRDSERRWRR